MTRILIHDYAGHPSQIQLSRELAFRGYSVHHCYAGGLATPRGSFFKKEKDPETLEFIKIPIGKNYKKWKYSFLKRFYLEHVYGKSLAKKVKEISPDVVISGNTPSDPQWLLVKFCVRNDIKVISWIQDCYSLAVERLVRKRFPMIGIVVGNFYKRLDKKVIQNSAAVISISPDFESIIKSMGGKQRSVFTIPNWASLDDIPQVEKTNAWSKSFGLEHTLNVIYSGTLALKHNPSMLVYLAEALKGEKNVKVVVISEGPGADYLQMMKSKNKISNLLLLPFQPFKVFAEVLGAADILVSLLEFEAGTFSVPSKILSSLCAGKPLLAAMPATNLGSKTISENDAGIVVEPDDVDGFISGAKKLLASQNLRREMGSRGREFAVSKFRISDICTRFEKVINK